MTNRQRLVLQFIEEGMADFNMYSLEQIDQAYGNLLEDYANKLTDAEIIELLDEVPELENV